MIEEHGDEAGFFGRLDAGYLLPKLEEIEEKSEVTIDRLDDYLSTKITDLIEDNSILQSIN